MQQFYLKKGKYIVNCSIKIKHILTTPFLICLTFLLFSQKTSAQTTTLDFEEYKNGNVVLGKTFDYEGFRFAINLQGLGQIVTRYDKGYNNTAALYDDNNVAGGITRYTISKIDGAEFQFRNVYLDNPTRWADSTGYIQGFKNGVAVGNPKWKMQAM